MSENDSDNEDFPMECIEENRVVNGQVQYLLKWRGYQDSDNTWVPEENLECTELIAAYEESEKCDSLAFGFDRGLEPSKILGMINITGELMLLMQWKGCDMPEFVAAKDANLKCPQLVIQFYEERIIWDTGEDTSFANEDAAID